MSKQGNKDDWLGNMASNGSQRHEMVIDTFLKEVVKNLGPG